ncbi:MAG TPA: histidine decarboxylase [Rugosimonospora sp.]|nr:histidine decarboxylase [Rugosimonospora sp.]
MPIGGERPPADVGHELVRLRDRLRAAPQGKVGFPGADDIDYRPLWNFFAYELNNIGDPYDTPTFEHHTKEYEREAVEFFADLFGAPEYARWGYVTSGSTECLQHGLLRARQRHPTTVTYYSRAAHYKVARTLADLRMPAVPVPVDVFGEMDYGALREAVAANRRRPVTVVATAGTTMTEAVDDVGQIHRVLDELGIARRYVHVDAALAGVPLALLPDDRRPAFDFRAGADSIGFSLHKFLATRMPGGIVIARTDVAPRGRRVEYTGAADTVVSCSRNGHLALMAWYAVRTLGVDGLRRRAEAARATAAHLVAKLTELRWPAWRNPYAFTVVMATPPADVTSRWRLATEGELSHYICMPGRSLAQADEFVEDLGTSVRAGARRRIPRQWSGRITELASAG